MCQHSRFIKNALTVERRCGNNHSQQYNNTFLVVTGYNGNYKS